MPLKHCIISKRDAEAEKVTPIYNSVEYEQGASYKVTRKTEKPGTAGRLPADNPGLAGRYASPLGLGQYQATGSKEGCS